MHVVQIEEQKLFFKMTETIAYMGQTLCRQDTYYQFLSKKYAKEHPKEVCYKIKIVKDYTRGEENNE